jgi:hypothetical protein
VLTGPKPIPVVSGENVGSIDAAVEPTGTYVRRFAEQAIGITWPTGSLRSQVNAIPLNRVIACAGQLSLQLGVIIELNAVASPADLEIVIDGKPAGYQRR